MAIHLAGCTTYLMLSVGQGGIRISEAQEQGPTMDPPPALCTWVRKYGQGRRITEISLSRSDRVVILGLAEGMLIAELTHPWANLYGVGTEGVLKAAAKAPRATLKLGGQYVAPEAPPAGLLEDDSAPVESAASLETQSRVRLAEMEKAESERAHRRLIKKARARLKRLQERVDSDLTRCQGADTLRKHGELLKGQLHKVTPKAQSVILDDWFEEGTPSLTLELNPRLDGPGNVEHIFKRYRKARDGIDRVRQRQAEIEKLRQRMEGLFDANLDLEDLRSGLIRLRLVSQQTGPRKHRQAVRKPYFEFTSCRGEPILVGRGGVDNHQTTFHHARGNDHWLHTRDCPGAHVIVPAPARNRAPHPETLRDAAALAVHHSKLRGEARVSVTHALRKHLKAVKGGRPGLVTVAAAKTMVCDDCTDRVSRLYAERDTAD